MNTLLARRKAPNYTHGARPNPYINWMGLPVVAVLCFQCAVFAASDDLSRITAPAAVMVERAPLPLSDDNLPLALDSLSVAAPLYIASLDD